jgi:hypothetical protein
MASTKRTGLVGRQPQPRAGLGGSARPGRWAGLSLGALAGLGLAMAQVTLAAPARADAIPPGPVGDECPDGTHWMGSHGMANAYCAATTCTDVSQCDAGLVCESRSYCSDWGGMISTCGVAGACDLGQCTSVTVCASPVPPSDDADSEGSCATRGGPASLGAAALLGAALLGWGLVRRRKR